MASGPRYKVQFRRRRELRTDYRKRLKLLSSGQPRVIVRASNKYVTAQMIKSVDAKDKVVSSAHSRELKKLGYPTGLSSAPAAYLTGILLARRAIKLGIDSAVLDTGIYARKPRSNVYAFLKGCVEGGLNVPHSEEVFADDSRVSGKHIAAYAQMLKDSAPEKYSKIFSLYIKAGAPPESLVELVETVKSKLDSIVGGV